MTFDAERATLGRRPALLCEIALDTCANHYGQTYSNDLTAPEDFTDAAWVNGGSGTLVVTANQATAPDGLLTADKLEVTVAGTFTHILQNAGAGQNAVIYQNSVFLKAGNAAESTVGLWDATIGDWAILIDFDWVSGRIKNAMVSQGSGDFKIDDLLDGWYRISMKPASGWSGTNVRNTIIYPAGLLAVTGFTYAWGAWLHTPATGTWSRYGAATCTAAGAAGSECFNTRETCQDAANYNKSAVPLTLGFSDTIIPGEPYLPCIDSADLAPTVINPEKGLGQRASIRVQMSDFPHHDRGLDPYVENRAYTPADQGTYFGKLLARNRHYVGRALRIKTGYLTGAGFDYANFQTRNYVIDNIEGPGGRGDVTITAKDILKLADDKRAVAPAPSTGALVAGITAGATSLTVTSGTESEYNAESDYIRIGDEIILAPVANRSANVFSNLTRGAFNTTAAAHGAGDSVQACKHLDGDNVVDLVADLLQNYAGIDAAYIVTADWNAERDTWYSSTTINTLIAEPEGVTKLINALAEQFFFRIWWNEIDQEINFRANVPPSTAATIPALADDTALIGNSVKVTRDEDKRLSRIIFYYDPYTPLEHTEAKDFQGFYVQILADEESAAEYNDVRQKIVYGRFVDSQALAVQTAGRTLSRWAGAPRQAEIEIDAKDLSIWTGDLIDLDSRRLQGETGANEITRFEIVSLQELTGEASGSTYRIRALETSYKNRYGYIGPNSLIDYDVESAANKAAYGFISPDTGIFSDGTDAYRII